jgi:hypothetical protein
MFDQKGCAIGCSPACAQNEWYDQLQKKCVPMWSDCPAGQFWDSTNQQCFPLCPKDKQNWNAAKKICEAPKQCGLNEWFDYVSDTCQPNMPTPGPQMCANMSGWHYDSTTQSCVKDGITCSQSLNFACGQCLPGSGTGMGAYCQYDNNGCPTGCRTPTMPTSTPTPTPTPQCGTNEWYDSATKTCKPMQPTTTPIPTTTPTPGVCPTTIYNVGTTSQCNNTTCPSGCNYENGCPVNCYTQTPTPSPTPQCGTNEWYDSATKTCKPMEPMPSTPPSCPSGQWYDYTSQICKSSEMATCPTGQYYDSASHTCKTASAWPRVKRFIKEIFSTVYADMGYVLSGRE